MLNQHDTIDTALLWTAVILALAFGVYFYGVLHLLLGVGMRHLAVPFAAFCIWGFAANLTMFKLRFTRKRNPKRRFGLYVAAAGYSGVLLLLMIYFGSQLGLIRRDSAHGLYISAAILVPAAFVGALFADRFIRNPE